MTGELQLRERPLVSVFMASHNAAAVIEETLDSVIVQTYEPLELVVVDDRSTDGTVEILERYRQAHPDRMRLHLKSRREGPCRARNEALALCTGSLLCWADHDDVWAPNKVELQVSVMREKPDVGLIYTYLEAFDSASGQELAWPDARRDQEGDVLGELFLIGCFIGSITTMFRREAVPGPLRLRDRDFSFGDDYALWLRIALRWQVALIRQPLVRYRRHAHNESDRIALASNLFLRIRELQLEFLREFPEARERLRRQWRPAVAEQTIFAARQELDQGRRGYGRWLAFRALLLDPETVKRTRWGRERHLK